jgi:membrane protein
VLGVGGGVGLVRPLVVAAAGVEARIERAVGGLYRWLGSNRATRGPWAVVQVFSDAQGALLAGSMAYYTFLSVLPLLMCSGAVIATLARFDLDVRQAIVDAVEAAFPNANGGEVLDQLIGARLTVGLVGIAALVYAGSGFIGALTACLNRMWDVPTGRNPVGQKLMNLAAVVLLAIVLVGSVSLSLGAEYLARETWGRDAGWVIAVLDVAAAPVALLAVLVLLYRLLPACPLRWRRQLPGAAFATAGIELLKRGFALWADRSGGIDTLPRSLVSVVLLLVWLGLFSQLILYGAAINVARAARPLDRGVTAGEPTT